MFDMFRGLGQFASVMRAMPKIKEEMERLQQRLGQIVVEGDAGAGMVKVRVNGRQEVLGYTISDDLMKQNDREMLEDLLKAATNQAMNKAREQVAEETGKLASGLGLPPGLNLPGLG
jgi:DNA-binding YbaB/EbfC family protein